MILLREELWFSDLRMKFRISYRAVVVSFSLFLLGSGNLFAQLDTIPPAAPFGLTATASVADVYLVWDKNNDSDFLRYRIYGGITPNPGTLIDSSSNNNLDTTKIISGLTNGTTYYFRVTAVDTNGNESGFSNEVSATPRDTIPPAQPANLTASVVSATIHLVWDSSAAGDREQFVLYRSLTNGFTVPSSDSAAGISPDAVSYDDSTVVSGNVYYYRVVAVDSSGNRSTPSAQAVADFAPPTSPAISINNGAYRTNNISAKLQLSAIGADSMKFTGDIVGGGVYVGYDTASIVSLTSGDGSKIITVVYKDIAGNTSSSVSSTIILDTTPPSAPAGLYAQRTDSSFIVSWNANSESDLSVYILYRSLTNSFSPASSDSLSSLSRSQTSFEDKNIISGNIYYYKLIAVDSTGNRSSASTQAIADFAPPTSPSIFAGTYRTSNTSVTVTVSAVGADSMVFSGNISNVGAVVPYATSHTVDLISGDGSKTIAVIFKDSVGNTSASVSTHILLDTTAPNMPAGISAAVSGGKIDLAWNANSESDLLLYRIYRSTVRNSETLYDSVLAPTHSYMDSSVTAGQKYFYKVSAVDSVKNESALSAEDSAVVPPSAPKNLAVLATSDTSIYLTWQQGSGSVLYFAVYRSIDNVSFNKIDTVSVAAYDDLTLSSATKYYYYVTAVSSDNTTSANSSTDSAMTKPSAPKNLTASTFSDTKIDLSWQAVTGVVLRYRIYAGTDSSTVGVIDSTSSLSYSNTGLSAGTIYFYKVTAVNSEGTEGAKSSLVQAVTNPAAPISPAASAVSPYSISTSWSSSGKISFYRLYRGTDTTGFSFIDTTSLLSYTHSGLHSATKYFFKITAVNSVGVEGNASGVVSARTFPSQVQGVTAAANGMAQINLNWTADSGGVARYRIYRGSDSMAVSLLDSSVSNTYADNSVSSSTRYYYRVSAFDSSGQEGIKSTASTAVSYPAQVQNVAISSVDSNSMLVTWNAVSGTVNHYTVYRGTDTTTMSQIGTTTAANLTATGLTSAVRYYFRVSASNEINDEGAKSFAATGMTPPAQVRNVIASSLDTTRISVSWNAVSGAISYYKLYRGVDSTSVAQIDTTSLTMYTNAGLSPATKYFYRISAVNNGGVEGAKSYADTAVTIPSQVKNLAANAVDTNKIQLTWYAVSGTPAHYVVYQGTDSVTMSQAGTAASTSFVAGGLLPATQYFFRISAVSEANQEGEKSSAGETMTKPSRPAKVTASSLDTTRIQISWNDISGKRAYFRIYRGADSTSLSLLDTTSATSYVNTALQPATKYFYSVSAVNTIGAEGVKSYADSAVTIPSRVYGLTAIAVDTIQINLSWNAVSGSPAHYNIYRGVDSVSMSIIGTSAGNSYAAGGLNSGERYFFRVSAVNEAGQEGLQSSSANSMTGPSQVRNVVATSLDTTGASIRWNTVSGAIAYYEVYRGTDSSSVVDIDSTSLTTYTDTGLSPATKYFYKISAVNTGGAEGAESYADSAVTFPSQVKNLAVSAVDTAQIQLTWNSVSGSPKRYNIYRGTDSLSMTKVDTASSSSYVARNLAAATRYYFRVSAVNEASQEGKKSDAATTVTLPSQVRNVIASTLDTTQIRITWNAVSGLKSYYKIYRGTDSTSATQIDTTSLTTYTNSGLLPATKYFYRVTAVNVIGAEGIESSADSAVTIPSQVKNVSASALDTVRIQLSWNAVSGLPSRYNIYQGTDSVTLNQVGTSTNPSFIATGLAPAKQYYFKVSAVNESGYEGLKSGTATAMTLPSQVRNLSAVPADSTEIDLSWNNVSGKRAYFKIYRGTDSTAVALIDSTTLTTYNDVTLATATQYFYRVSAVNTMYGEGQQSDAATGATPPSQVRNVLATGLDTAKIKLTWNRVPGSPLRYRIYRGLDSNAVVFMDSTTALSYTDTKNLSPASVYYYRVVAVNVVFVEGMPSDAALGVTLAGQVKNLTAGTLDTTAISLSWNPVSGTIARYRIYRGTTDSSLASLVQVDSTVGTSYVNGGLISSTRYYYRVRAVNVVGKEGLQSFASTDVTVPSQIQNVQVTPLDTVRISLTWNAVAGTPYRYRIYRGADTSTSSLIDSTTGLSYTNVNLLPSTRYYYRVAAVNEIYVGGLKSDPSSSVTYPAVPQSVSSTTLDSNRVALSWQPGRNGAAYYHIYAGVDSTGLSVLDTTSLLSYTSSRLTPSTRYYFRIASVNSIGLEGSANRTVSSVTKPVQPRSFVVSVLDTHRVSLSWISGGGTNVFRIYRSNDSTTFQEVDSTSGISAVDDSLAPGTKYFYKVAAVNPVGLEGPSTPILSTETKPTTPRNLVAQVLSDNVIKLSWQSGGGTVSYYRIYHGSMSTSLTLLDSTTGTTYDHTGLAPSTSHFYEVAAVNSAGNESDHSNQASAVTSILFVKNIAAVAVDSQRVALRWDSVGVLNIHYKVYAGTDSNSVTFIDTTSDLKYTVAGLRAATRHYFRVSVVNASNAEGNKSYAVAAVTYPGAPYAVTAGVVDTGSVTLRWNATGSEIQNFRMYRGIVDTIVNFVGVSAGSPFTDAGLISGTTYYYRISGVNVDTVEGAKSAVASVTTLTAPPQNLTATNVTSTSLRITWSLSPRAIGYLIYRASADIDSSYVLIDSINALVYDDSPLVPGTRYFYRVKSLNINHRASAFSQTIHPVTLTAKPDSLAAAVISKKEIDVSWRQGIGITHQFHLYRSSGAGFTIAASVPSFSLKDSLLKPSTLYNYYAVGVNDDSVEGISSDTVSARTLKSDVATTLDSVSGIQISNVALSFHVPAVQQDTLVVKGWYAFKGDTVFHQATLQNPSARFVTRDDIDTWLAENDIAGKDTTVLFYLSVTAPDTSVHSNSISIRMDLNRPPHASVDNLLSPQGGDITLTYHLSDAEDDILHVVPQYSTDGGATWTNAVHVTGVFSNIDSTHYNGSFVWHSRTDFTDSVYVRFRVIPFDRDSGIAVPQSTDFEVLNNSLAEIQIDSLQHLLSGDITINYRITKGATPISLKPEYSLDGVTFYPMRWFIGDTSNIMQSNYVGQFIWRSRLEANGIDSPHVFVRITPANFLGPCVSDTSNAFELDNLPPAFAGIKSATPDSALVHLHWNFATDAHAPITYYIFVGTASQNYGFPVDSVTNDTARTIYGLQNFTRYYFRVLAQDRLGNRDTNFIEATAMPTSAPQLEYVRVVLPQVNIASRRVTIVYHLLGNPADSVQLQMSYSLDNGKTWILSNRITGRVAGVSPGAAVDTLFWDAKTDLPYTDNDSVAVALLPVGIGKTGKQVSSQMFTLDNVPPQFTGVQSIADDTVGNALTVTWFHATDRHAPVLFYIYLGENDSSKLTFTLPYDSTTNPSDTSKILTGLKNFVKYFIAVRSYDAAGNIDQNTYVLTGTPSQAVKIISLSTPGVRMRDSIYFAYTISAAAEDTIQLKAEYSADNGTSWLPAKAIDGTAANITAANFTDSLLWVDTQDTAHLEATTMKFRVQPFGRITSGPKKATNTFSIDTKPPSFFGLYFVANNTKRQTGSVVLGWPKGSDMTPPITYRVFESETSSVYNRSVTLMMTKDDSVLIPNLQSLTKYYYNVWAEDSLGNIDSNLVEQSITTSVLGDFTSDGRIDVQDLAVFVNAWQTNDTLIGDIGPASGTIPQLRPLRDDKINIEDIATFVQMWNWAYDNGIGFNVSAKFVKTQIDSSFNSGVIQFPEETIIKKGETKPIALSIAGVKDIAVAGISFSYDPATMRVDSVVPGSMFDSMRVTPVLLTKIDNKLGELSSAVADFSGKFSFVPDERDYIVVYVTALKAVRDEEIHSSFEVYNRGAKLVKAGELTFALSDRPKIPLTFAVSQNYPNPFNPTTSVEYQLPTPSAVILRVYNILGQEVTQLVHQNVNAGYYTIRWNASSVASGVYFYVFEATALNNKNVHFVSVKKMMVIK